MTEKTDITALVTARICHDLASPIGAIGNGVELVELRGNSLGEEGELVKASVNATVAKLKLFRIAYGQFHAGEILNAASLSRANSLEHHWPDSCEFCPKKNAEGRLENLSFNIAIYSSRHAAGG
jgi:hypothetical protein